MTTTNANEFPFLQRGPKAPRRFVTRKPLFILQLQTGNLIRYVRGTITRLPRSRDTLRNISRLSRGCYYCSRGRRSSTTHYRTFGRSTYRGTRRNAYGTTMNTRIYRVTMGRSTTKGLLVQRLFLQNAIPFPRATSLPSTPSDTTRFFTRLIYLVMTIMLQGGRNLNRRVIMTNIPMSRDPRVNVRLVIPSVTPRNDGAINNTTLVRRFPKNVKPLATMRLLRVVLRVFLYMIRGGIVVKTNVIRMVINSPTTSHGATIIPFKIYRRGNVVRGIRRVVLVEMVNLRVGNLILSIRPITFINGNRIITKYVNTRYRHRNRRHDHGRPRNTFRHIFRGGTSLLRGSFEFNCSKASEGFSISKSRRGDDSEIPFPYRGQDEVSLLPSPFQSIVSVPE